MSASPVFAWSPDDERFAWGAWGTAATGAPVITDACAWLDCTLHSRHAAGGHTLYVGLVAASATPRAGSPPLLYWNRGYRRLSSEAG